MSDTKCELCGGPVRVVGKTTLSYEAVNCPETPEGSRAPGIPGHWRKSLTYHVDSGRGDSFHALALEHIKELEAENVALKTALDDRDEVHADHVRQVEAVRMREIGELAATNRQLQVAAERYRRALERIVGETWILTRKDLDRLLEIAKEALEGK